MSTVQKRLVIGNTKEKQYLNGYKKLTFCSKKIFHDHSFDKPKTKQIEEEEKEEKPKNMNNPTRKDSVKRAVEKVFDIAYLNEFDYFITWTLDGSIIDRYDPTIISKKIKKWLNNYSQRKGLMYLVIPEYHKDGAIHFHGLISGDVDMIDSGKTDKDGHTIFNMPQWKYGFSTAIRLYGDVEHTAKYITKYITKDLKKIFGSFYFAGGGVDRNPNTVVYNSEYREIPGTTFPVEVAGYALKYGTIKGGEYYAT